VYTTLAGANPDVTFIDDIWENVWGETANVDGVDTNMMSLDNIHPSKAGCEMMSLNYLDAMRSCLQANGLIKEEPPRG
jgi:hypothetical protein